MSDQFLYFAYGSNMWSRRLKERTPSAVSIGTAFIERYRLTFDTVSTGGSGKCDIEPTENSADKVWGVLFSIAVEEERHLDNHEGLGQGYRKGHVQAITSSGTSAAVAYFATKKDASFVPYDWYKEFVVLGAEEHKLPGEYITTIKNVPARIDSDDARVAKNKSLRQLEGDVV